MDDLFASLIGALNLPTSVVLGLVLVLAVVSLFAGRWPAWAGMLLSAARAGAWAALRRKKPELAVKKTAQKSATPTTSASVPGEVAYVEPARWSENVVPNDDPSSSNTGGG